MGRSVNWFLIRVLSVESGAGLVTEVGTAVPVVRNPTVSASILLEMMNCTSKRILDLYQFK